jgi:hypothetical protein
MGKQLINMIGGGFQHVNCSSHGHSTEHMTWVKDNSANISIHIDGGLKMPVNKNKLNYGWLSESKTIIGGLYSWCVNNIQYLEDNFELVFTHDTSLLALSDKFKLVICSAKYWVSDVGLHNKSKLVSMIASNKVMCPDHRYRQSIVAKYRNQVDLFGRGFNPIDSKDEGLKDYHFSIAMENGTYPLMYSEKLTDCFATGTIPIYYGTPLIGDIFNTDGIITLDDKFNIEDLTPELYHSKLDAIKENLELVIEMPVAEDYIFKKYIS